MPCIRSVKIFKDNTGSKFSFDNKIATSDARFFPRSPAGSTLFLLLKFVTDKSTHYFPVIDGLRGIAILMVIATHTLDHGVRISSGEVDQFFVQAIARGRFGVQLFFVISAFTLFSSTLNRFKLELSPRRNFYLRRFFRILPFWWLVIAIYTILFSYKWGETAPSIFMYFGFIRFKEGAEMFDGQWSIFVEESFYLILPLVFTWLQSFTNAVKFALLTLAVSIGWSFTAPRLGIPIDRHFVEWFPLSQWFCFSLGILACHLYSSTQFNERFLQTPRFRWFLDLGSLLLVTDALITQRHTVIALAFLSIVLAALSPHTILNRILRNDLLRRFGICCYSIYLLHLMVIALMIIPKQRLFVWLGITEAPILVRFAVYFPIIAAINLVLGIAMYSLFERTFILWGKRLVTWLETPTRHRYPSFAASDVS